MVSTTPRGMARRWAYGLHRAFRVLPALALGVAAGCGAQGAGEPIVFGVAAPLQESYGESTRRGIELGLRQIAAENGVNGRPLELRYVDDGANQSAAIVAAESLLQDDRVVAVIGHVNSSTTIAAAPFYQEGRLPAVATSATNPRISQLGDWIFRIAPSDSAIAVRLAEFAHRRGGNIAIYYSNEDYGRGLARNFRRALIAAGGSVVSLNPYLDDMEDFTPYLEVTRRQNVSTVLVAGVETGAARLIRQARELGLDARFIGGDGLEGLTDMGPLYDGTLVGVLFHPDASEQARRFAAAYAAEYGGAPDSFAATAYDALMLLARAARAGHTSRDAIRDYLAAVGVGGSPAFDGASGSVRFDANGDPADKAFSIVVLRDGRREVYADE